MGETQRAALAETFGSFPHIIAANAAALDSQIAMRDDEGELSWAALGERVERIAARLVADGLERGQAVAILGYSSIPYALVFLAAVRAAKPQAAVVAGAAAQSWGSARSSRTSTCDEPGAAPCCSGRPVAASTRPWANTKCCGVPGVSGWSSSASTAARLRRKRT